MCLCTLTCTITLLCKQLHFCVGKTETSWTVAGPSGHSHQTHNFQQFRLTTCNRFLPLTSHEHNECLDLTTPEDEADNPIIIPSSSADDSQSSDSISDNHSTHSVTSLGSTTHNEAHHSITDLQWREITYLWHKHPHRLLIVWPWWLARYQTDNLHK